MSRGRNRHIFAVLLGDFPRYLPQLSPQSLGFLNLLDCWPPGSLSVLQAGPYHLSRPQLVDKCWATQRQSSNRPHLRLSSPLALPLHPSSQTGYPGHLKAYNLPLLLYGLLSSVDDPIGRF